MRSQFFGAFHKTVQAGDFSLSHWITGSPGKRVRPHGHAEAHFMYVPSGEFITIAAGSPARYRAKLIYNPPNTYHADRMVGSGQFFALSIPPNLSEMLRELRLPSVPQHVSSADAFALTRRLLAHCLRGEPGPLLCLESLCFELLSTASTVEADRAEPRWLSRAREFLNDCYAGDVSITELSRTVGVHPVHLARTFRKVHGCTPGEYLRSRRIANAIELLTTTRRALTDIAMAVGFADQSHFTKHFGRATGMPPAQYRSIATR